MIGKTDFFAAIGIERMVIAVGIFINSFDLFAVGKGNTDTLIGLGIQNKCPYKIIHN
jgi:hypothetical protein